MLVDTFKDDPFFPFAGYATDIQHFIGAQRYWLTLLPPQQVAQAQDLLDWTPGAAQIAGMTPEAARRDAALIYTPFTSHVERSEIYLPQSGHPEGGVLVPAPHLLLQSEISRECELLAVDRLSDFLRSVPPT